MILFDAGRRRNPDACPAATAWRSTGACSRIFAWRDRGCSPAACRSPTSKPRSRCAALPPSMCHPGSSAGRGRRTRPGSGGFSTSRAHSPSRNLSPARPPRVLAHDASQYLSRRPRRPRPVRQLRRPFRRRDPDAADPRARARVRGGQGRSGLWRRARRLARGLRRPADASVSGRAPERPARWRPRLLQARRARPYRRPQDQQHHRPDPARPAHGQAPHHRRDRRRPAWRGDRDRGGAPRSRMRGLHGRARHRAAAAERVPHAPARRRGARRASPARPRSRTP